MPRDGSPTDADRALAQTWLADRFAAANVPFSFVYDGQPSAAQLPRWQQTAGAPEAGEKLTHQTFTYKDPASGLLVRADVTVYADYPAVEWVLYFENTGAVAAPILENVQALDADLGLPGLADAASQSFVLHYANGSQALATDFALKHYRLDPESAFTLAPNGGRSSDGVLPFFNLVRPNQTGVMMAVGWSGQWQATFTRDPAAAVRAQAGMQLTHLSLLPGEQIRTPRMLLLFWQGEQLHASNLLRRLILDHYTPRPNSGPYRGPIWSSSSGDIGFNDITEENQIASAEAIAANGLPIDYYQIDAGWFENGWPNTGTWEPHPKRFPRGLKPVGDAVHALGLGFILWFEPERVVPGTWLANEHPEWLIGTTDVPGELAYQANWKLLNLGNPEALAWAETMISGLISEYGVDIYRHDFNMFPLYAWRATDAPDRQGLAETRYVEGLYAFWDYLMAQHPGLLIDNSASGGRRLDLETISRSVPLFRTDYFWVANADQDMTYALSQWLPIHAMGVHAAQDTYTFRSGMGTSVALAYNYLAGPPWDWLRDRLAEYNLVRDYFYGDYYPLVSGVVDGGLWVAYQFDRPDLGEGMVLAFQREGKGQATLTPALGGLNPAATYEFTNADTGEVTTLTGAEAAAGGLPITLDGPRQSALITYHQLAAN
ncbi:MAG: alpha-galactosidase [Anaerolineales bacterium]|nr:alpha-galactosidase [Anaerolineales bacterium]